MPGKSHRKDKKLAKAVRQPAAVIPPTVSVIPGEVPAVQPAVTAPAAAPPKAVKPAPVPTSVYISRELLTISLLASGMLAVVIIVSLILR